MRKTYYVKLKQKPQKNSFKIFIFFIASTAGILLFFNFLKRTNPPGFVQPKVLSSSNSVSQLFPVSPSPSPINTVISTITPIEDKELGQAVQNALMGTYGSYGVVIKNLKTAEQYTLQENTQYAAASLYKLWVMAATYKQIKDGKLNDNDILSENVAVLNTKFQIPPESAELKEGKITLSVHDALEKMINISDNYAALLLTEKIRLSTISLFLIDNGFSQSSISENGKPPMTTPHDIALYFEKLYNGRLIDANYSNKMISLLREQKLNDKIPRYLPYEVNVAHKTGELDEYTHDAGIVYVNNYDYIIVVLSKSDDPELAAIRIANVSEAVYNYFEAK